MCQLDYNAGSNFWCMHGVLAALISHALVCLCFGVVPWYQPALSRPPSKSSILTCTKSLNEFDTWKMMHRVASEPRHHPHGQRRPVRRQSIMIRSAPLALACALMAVLPQCIVGTDLAASMVKIGSSPTTLGINAGHAFSGSNWEMWLDRLGVRPSSDLSN